MPQKVFITDDKMATFICPECSETKAADVSKYKQINKEVRLKIKCACGFSYSVLLERRQQFRKTTAFPGKYTSLPSSGSIQQGDLTVKDISRTGLKLELKMMPGFIVGDRLSVEFRLDDKQKTMIKKEVVVKKISNRFVGSEFCSLDPSNPSDKALGFYLF